MSAESELVVKKDGYIVISHDELEATETIGSTQSIDAMRMEIEITAVTLNCWGLAYVSKDRVPRMTAIAEELASGKYDFVFLQEVWTTEDYERIKSKCKVVLPYSHYFYSGVVGAGICIFSKSPIVGAFFHQWAVNGYVHKIQHGDWFGGKGIGMVEVLHRGLRINLYTAHLHAEYDRVNDEYLAHRVTQAYDTAQFISLTSRRADVTIVGGDLNTEPGDLAYRVIVHTAQLQDSYFEAVAPNGQKDAMNTNETPSNSYSSPGCLKSNPYGKRIDYIVYKPGEGVTMKTLMCETPWPNRVPGQSFSYSDHDAVVTKLKIIKSSSGLAEPPPSHEESKKEALINSIEICSQALRQLKFSKNIYFVLSILCLIGFFVSSTFDYPGLLYYLLPVLRTALLFMFAFGIFMSIIWNRMEVHGILAGKLGMELELEKAALLCEVDNMGIGGGLNSS